MGKLQRKINKSPKDALQYFVHNGTIEDVIAAATGDPMVMLERKRAANRQHTRWTSMLKPSSKISGRHYQQIYLDDVEPKEQSDEKLHDNLQRQNHGVSRNVHEGIRRR